MVCNCIEIDRMLNQRWPDNPEVGMSRIILRDENDKAIKAFQTDLIDFQNNTPAHVSLDFVWRVYPNGQKHHVTRMFISYEYSQSYALVADCSGAVGLVQVRVVPVIRGGL